jgi:hypothetical protein
MAPTQHAQGLTPDHTDVAYGTYCDPSRPASAEKLDLYIPASARSGAPPATCVVQVHGGGYWQGVKSDFFAEFGSIEALYAQGVIIASINYPLTEPAYHWVPPNVVPNAAFPNNPLPFGLQSGLEAVQFLRDQAATYNIDPDRIYGIGGSAGGTVLSFTALSADAADPLGSSQEQQSSRLDGVVLLSTPTWIDRHHVKIEDLVQVGGTWQNVIKQQFAWAFGVETNADFNNETLVPLQDTLDASPGWLAANAAGVGSGENEAVPILAVYGDYGAGSGVLSSAYGSPPYADPHHHYQGLLLQDAFRISYTGSGFTLNPSAPIGWEDFGMHLVVGSSQTQQDLARDAILAWIEARATRVHVTEMGPASGNVPASTPFAPSAVIHVGPQSMTDFLAGITGSPVPQDLLLGVWGGTFAAPTGTPVILDYDDIVSLGVVGLIQPSTHELELTLPALTPADYATSFGNSTFTVAVGAMRNDFASGAPVWSIASRTYTAVP